MGSSFQIIQVGLIRGKWRVRVGEGGLMMETEGQNQKFEDADTAGFEAGLKLQITGYPQPPGKGEQTIPWNFWRKPGSDFSQAKPILDFWSPEL